MPHTPNLRVGFLGFNSWMPTLSAFLRRAFQVFLGFGQYAKHLSANIPQVHTRQLQRSQKELPQGV